MDVPPGHGAFAADPNSLPSPAREPGKQLDFWGGGTPVLFSEALCETVA